MKTKVLTSVAMILVLFASLVSAQGTGTGTGLGTSGGTPLFSILNIEVDDLNVFPATAVINLDKEVGETIDIEVTVQGGPSLPGGLIDNLRIITEVNGYEFGTLRDETAVFSLEEDVVKKFFLSIDVPNDMEASEFYELVVRIVGQGEQQVEVFSLHIDEPRNFLNTFNVFINPSTRVQAGQPIFVTALVENFGERAEKTAVVRFAIPTLGVQNTVVLDELVTRIDEEEEQFRSNERDKRTAEAMLRIPVDAPQGEYNVEVRVDYNRGRNTEVETRKIFVEGVQQEETTQIVFNVDSTSKTAKPGEEIAYRLTVANLGEEKKVLSVRTDGNAGWSEVRVEPSFLTVMPDSTAEAVIYVTPIDGAEARGHVFTARLLDGNQVVNEFNLNTQITGDQKEQAAASTASVAKNTLIAVFAVLVIILIILAVVAAMKKMGRAEEEPSADLAEGQTYYYTPKR